MNFKFLKLAAILFVFIQILQKDINLASERNTEITNENFILKEKSKTEISELTKNFTLILDGVTEGSGVIVSKEGRRYRVLTAWHVVKDNKIKDEVIITTRDGKKHIWDPNSIQRIRNLDLATFTFQSRNNYQIPLIGNSTTIKEGEEVFVGGYPSRNKNNSNRIFRFQFGNLRANAKIFIEDGYQLLYSNRTVNGMSGGPLLNKKGELIGIHGRAEIDKKLSAELNKLIATGTNKAIPISYYEEFIKGTTLDLKNDKALTKDDYLAQASSLIGKNGKEKDIINLSQKAIQIEEDPLAYFYIGLAKYLLKDLNKSLDSFSKAIQLDPSNASSFYNRALIKSDLKDFEGASKDYKKALELSPKVKKESSDLPPIIKNLKSKSENLALSKEDLKSLKNIITMTVFDKLSGGKEGRDSTLDLLNNYNNQMLEELPKAMDKFSKFLDSDAIEKDMNKLFGILNNEKNYLKEKKDLQKEIGEDSFYYLNKGNSKYKDKQFKAAIFNYSKAIRLEPQGGKNGLIFYLRAEAKLALGELKSACIDYKKAISKGNKKSKKYLNSKEGKWCKRIL